jgi:uncharacterized protein (TIGR00661 family)
MKILYGVVGEGMGHATRSAVIIDHLLDRGHTVSVVVSGRAFQFLSERFGPRDGITIEKIEGFHLEYEGAGVDVSDSILANLERAPERLWANIGTYLRLTDTGYEPDAVISDFESWAYLFGLNHMLPVISIDNMQVLNRCRHDFDVTDFESGAFKLAKYAVKAKLPGVYHYLVASFFFPPVRKKRTTLIPPILRPEILAAKREPRDHVLVYQTASTNVELIPALRRMPWTFRVYGMGGEGTEGNVTLCPFSSTGFVEDLRTARAVVAGGGFSLMSEVVHLRIPMLSVPLKGQYEQQLNARYLVKLGYGMCADHLGGETLSRFLENTRHYERALEAYPSQDNSMTFRCLDELLQRIADGESRPVRLTSPAMGKYRDDE